MVKLTKTQSRIVKENVRLTQIQMCQWSKQILMIKCVQSKSLSKFTIKDQKKSPKVRQNVKQLYKLLLIQMKRWLSLCSSNSMMKRRSMCVKNVERNSHMDKL